MATSEFEESTDVDALLGKLPLELRSKTLAKAVRAGMKPAQKEAKRLAPVGDKNHHPEKKALKKTIITKVKKYANGEIHMAIMGPSWPEGAHGHLVDKGHKLKPKKNKNPATPFKGGRVEGKEFLAPAADNTVAEQEAAMVAKIVEGIKSVGG